MDLMDLSQVLSADSPLPDGFPRFNSERLSTGDDELLMHLYHLHLHQGTHIDAPCHFIPGAESIEQLALSRFLTRASVVHLQSVSRDMSIGPAAIDGALPSDWEPGRALLIRTGWGRHWDDAETYFAHPYLTPEAVDLIVSLKPSMLGLDMVTPEVPVRLRGDDHSWAAHKALLGDSVLIVENLNLEPLAGIDATTFLTLPPKWEGADGGQVRAVAMPGLTLG